MRVVDTEHPHPAVDPAHDYIPQRIPEAAPILGLPVDVVDVLVALRRVLRVLERPIRAAVEPLGVLGQPRVVGGALDREVERDVHFKLPCRGRKAPEVLLGTELGVDGVVATLC